MQQIVMSVKDKMNVIHQLNYACDSIAGRSQVTSFCVAVPKYICRSNL